MIEMVNFLVICDSTRTLQRISFQYKVGSHQGFVKVQCKDLEIRRYCIDLTFVRFSPKAVGNYF